MTRINVTFVIMVFQIFTNNLLLGQESELLNFESQFSFIPLETDIRWIETSKDDMREKIQFLVDNANSNYERIQTWSGIYQQTLFSHLGVDKYATKDATSKEDIPYCSLLTANYSFFRDNRRDASFISVKRVAEKVYNYKNKELTNNKEKGVLVSDFKAIFDSESTILFQEGLLFPAPRLNGVVSGDGLQLCLILPTDKIQRSPHGNFFDPQFFFHTSLTPVRTYWHTFEKMYLPMLNGQYGDDKKDSTLKKIRFFELKEKDDDNLWYRIEVSFDSYVLKYFFSSASGYNLLFHSVQIDGKTTQSVRQEYRKINNVYIPSMMLSRFSTNVSAIQSISASNTDFMFLKLVSMDINKPIPSRQFSLDALGLDENVIIQNDIDGTYYEYQNGTLYPMGSVGGVSNAVSESMWKSPHRLIAFTLGILLLIFGITYKIRRRIRA